MLEALHVCEAGGEGFAEVIEGAVRVLHLREEFGEGVVPLGAVVVGDGATDNLGRVVVEDGGIEGVGAAVGFEALGGPAYGEVRGAEVGDDGGGGGIKLEGAAIKTDGAAIVLLGVQDAPRLLMASGNAGRRARASS